MHWNEKAIDCITAVETYLWMCISLTEGQKDLHEWIFLKLEFVKQNLSEIQQTLVSKRKAIYKYIIFYIVTKNIYEFNENDRFLGEQLRQYFCTDFWNEI